jgi:hypothetical protein
MVKSNAVNAVNTVNTGTGIFSATYSGVRNPRRTSDASMIVQAALELCPRLHQLKKKKKESGKTESTSYS